jgi:hypothetical protein
VCDNGGTPVEFRESAEADREGEIHLLALAQT